MLMSRAGHISTPYNFIKHSPDYFLILMQATLDSKKCYVANRHIGHYSEVKIQHFYNTPNFNCMVK